MRTRYLYLNGDIVEADKARISPFDIGLLRGYAVFDLLRTVGGHPFLLAEHLGRLRASAAEIGLSVPATDEEITDAIEKLLVLNDHGEATVRLVVTGGVSSDGMHLDTSIPTFFILTHDLPVLAEATYAGGAKLVTHEHQRECPAAKSTNYLTLLAHQQRVSEAGAIDLLYHENGRISEAATASFYVVKDGRILAPKDDVLPGTIGQLVLDLVADDYEIAYVDVSVEDVFDAEEAFLTSTTRGVVPIVEIDGRPVGDGSVGPVTAVLMARFLSAIANAGPQAG